MYKRILVPLDGTPNDNIVLEHVKDLARQHRAELTLLQLYRIMKADEPFMKRVQMEIGSLGYQAKQKAEAYLAEREDSMKKEGFEVSGIFLVVEDPEADAIVKYAEENGFDLIALTNQERGGISRWFFGNIEERVRRRSSLPVLFVSK
ncbi:MAG: universal stress protein [Proteobacteria bacterium]|nr:universal stress protein [Pseudomonadota bacterium]